MSGRVVHFVLHVPKCAGTTVEEHFRLPLHHGFLIAPRWEHVLRNFIGNRYLYPPDAPRLKPVKMVSGHSLSVSLMRHFPGAEIRESVLLREPLGYFLSLYNYRWTWHDLGHGPRPPEFAHWYRAQRRNPISRFLLSRYFEWGVPAIYGLSSAGRLDWLEARLRRFWFVGSYRKAGEMIAGISRELGLPEAVQDRNVTYRKRETAESLGPETCAQIAEDNRLDQMLFDRWKDRGWRKDAAPAPGPASGLSRLDQPRYLAGDIASSIARLSTKSR